MIRWFKLALIWGLFFGSTLYCHNSPVVVHIFFTESNNGILTNCLCPAQPYGGLPRRKTLMDSLRWRYSESIFLDAGNFLSSNGKESNQQKVIESMAKMNYDAVNLGINDIRFFQSHVFSNVDEGLPLISSNNTFTSIPDFKWINIKDYNILILGTSRDNYLSAEINDNCKMADLIVLLSQVDEHQNKMLIDAYPDKIHLILGNSSKSSLLGKYERYQNTLLVNAGIEGNSIADIQVKLSDQKPPVFEDIVFHKVNQDIIPDPEIESIIFKKGVKD